jgi:ribosomal silencing factor RsfS
MDNRFNQDTFHIRKHVLTFAGAKLEVFDAQEQVLFFSKMKAFKLKEDIRIYSGEDMQEEFISIHARSMLDFSATYDVLDSKIGQKIGALRRHGMKSMLKDEWSILDANDMVVGLIQEDNLLLALLRRFIGLIPQSYKVEMNGITVAEFKQNFNPFVVKLDLDFAKDRSHSLDRRLGLAAGILLCVIEGKQD